MIQTNDILRIIHKDYRNAATALHNKNALEMLIATILSAQCTDERVNQVTKNLFKKYKTTKDYANANIKMFEQEIKSTGFYKNKAKNIINCCKVLVEKHDGKIPSSLEELIKLPGVGRKTANVILGAVFNKAEGIVVDTHVKRVSFRLGLTKNKNPEKIEQDLMHEISKEEWIFFSNALIWHGRKVCNARKPLCSKCHLNKICPRNGVIKSQ
ncbi:endonuclease III [Candidatus Woesearchaeota archaeon]|nr:endonuclease III [Candidatus Woesearchaeota archaeon]